MNELRTLRSLVDQLADHGKQPAVLALAKQGSFKGYHKLPDKTAEAFTPDGWFRAGDLGRFDADGYLYVTGRVKTLIVAEGGEKAQPDQVEESYQQHPVLREVGVLQKEGWLVSVIVPAAQGIEQRERDQLDQAVRAAVEEQSRRIPSYQRLADYVISREALPRTQLGKIQRHKLEERFERVKQGAGERQETAGPIAQEEMNPEDRVLLNNPAAQQVWDWLAERFPDRRLTPDTSPQLDLGIDSLEWLRFGSPLDPQRLEQETEGESPQDRIARALHDHVAELQRRPVALAARSERRPRGA